MIVSPCQRLGAIKRVEDSFFHARDDGRQELSQRAGLVGQDLPRRRKRADATAHGKAARNRLRLPTADKRSAGNGYNFCVSRPMDNRAQ
jgi:hypothetical protein